MQVIFKAEEVNQFLHDLGYSLKHKQADWKDWSAVHIFPRQDEFNQMDTEQQQVIAKMIRALLPGNDGALLCLHDQTFLLLCHWQNLSGLDTIMSRLNYSTNICTPCLFYEEWQFMHDQEEIVDLIESYLGFLIENHCVQHDHSENDLLCLLNPSMMEFFNGQIHFNEMRQYRHKPQILLVDDDPLTRRIVGRALKDEYPLITAGNASEALEKHLLFAPDMVFLDIGLPDGDGFMVLEHIQYHDTDCQVIMFSSHSFLNNRLRALCSGANGFLPKPFSKKSFDAYLLNEQTATLKYDQRAW